MWRFLKVYAVLCIAVQCSWAINDIADKKPLKTAERNELETTLTNIERLTMLAEKSRRDGVLPSDDTDELFEKVTTSIGDLTELIEVNNETYSFFKQNGVDRVLIPNIRTDYVPLRGQLLLLVKTLFNTAPITTNTLLPANIVDMLLDVFENDKNLALKAHALDVLYIWLPNNPRLQARVMKLKGLEPFYEQIAELDSDGIYKLLDLFNTILEEHLNARNRNQKNRNDYEKLKIYEMIGLIERMATSTVCNGLLNIFKATVEYSDNNEDIIAPVFKLINNIKPYCMTLYKGKSAALKIFKEIHSYIKDNKDIDFERLGLNAKEIDFILNEYIEQLGERYKDEL